MRTYLLSALLAGAVAAPAFAQTAAPFTGLRAEGVVGYDTTDVEDEGADGVLYGAALGYDFQAGRAVLGVEGELTDSTVDECAVNVDSPGDQLCASFGRDIYVGGRAGVAVSPTALLYAKAGYTNARIAADYDDGTAAGLNDFSLSDELDGVRVGAGGELAVGPNSYVKAEYRYSNYEDGFDRHQAVAGFGFRF